MSSISDRLLFEHSLIKHIDEEKKAPLNRSVIAADWKQYASNDVKTFLGLADQMSKDQNIYLLYEYPISTDESAVLACSILNFGVVSVTYKRKFSLFEPLN